MAFNLGVLGSLVNGLGSAGMGTWNAFGGGYKDPTARAMQTIGQVPGKVEPYYQPWMEAGKGALGDLQSQYKDLLAGDTYNKLASGYKESPGYQFKLNQALNAAGNAQAAGGMLGTPQHQQGNMELANDIASQDFQNYLNSQMGLYGMGLQGEQGLNQMGYGASDAMANTLANALSQQGQMQFYGDAGRNIWKNQGIGNIFSGLGQAAGALSSGDILKQLAAMLGHGGA